VNSGAELHPASLCLHLRFRAEGDESGEREKTIKFIKKLYFITHKKKIKKASEKKVRRCRGGTNIDAPEGGRRALKGNRGQPLPLPLPLCQKKAHTQRKKKNKRDKKKLCFCLSFGQTKTPF